MCIVNHDPQGSGTCSGDPWSFTELCQSHRHESRDVGMIVEKDAEIWEDCQSMLQKPEATGSLEFIFNNFL